MSDAMRAGIARMAVAPLTAIATLTAIAAPVAAQANPYRQIDAPQPPPAWLRATPTA